MLILQTPDTSLVAQVRADLLRHPIEIVATDTVATTVRSYALLDVDNDGRPEVFLAITPKYRQTATIVIYRALDSNRIGRLYEGLAPGALVVPSGRQVDTHTLGNGIDFTAEGKPDSTILSGLLRTARERSLHIVRYPGFFHADHRPQAASFIDLGFVSLEPTIKNCEGFQFAAVENLLAGHLGSDATSSYLVTLTSGDITIYKFSGTTRDGRLLKEVWVRPRPNDLVAIRTTSTRWVEGVRSDGSALAIPVPR